MTSKKKVLSLEELAESSRLKEIWESKKSDLGLSQETLGALLGISQGAVTQYLNGHTRIGDLTLFKFAYHLQFDPSEVRPDFFQQHPELLHGLPVVYVGDSKSSDTARRIRELDDKSLSAVESLLSVLESR